KKLKSRDESDITSPVYKCVYRRIIKAVLDLLPQDVFKSKVVLPTMLGGSYKHLLAIEYTLTPVISILKGNSLNGVYIVDNKVDKKLENQILDQQIYDRIIKQIEELEEE